MAPANRPLQRPLVSLPRNSCAGDKAMQKRIKSHTTNKTHIILESRDNEFYTFYPKLSRESEGAVRRDSDGCGRLRRKPYMYTYWLSICHGTNSKQCRPGLRAGRTVSEHRLEVTLPAHHRT